MAAPFILIHDVSLGERFGCNMDCHTSPIGSRGFWLMVNGYDDTRCHYAPTYGFEGFGRARRKVRYPSGKIIVELLTGNRDVLSLDAAKELVASTINAQFK